MAKAVKPDNGYDATEVADYIERVQSLQDKITDATVAHMDVCKKLRGDISDVYVEAKGKGMPLRALKAEIKLQALDKKKEKLIAEMDSDDVGELDALRDVLGDRASIEVPD